MLVDTQKLVSPERFTLLFSTMQMPAQASVCWLKYTTGSKKLNNKKKLEFYGNVK